MKGIKTYMSEPKQIIDTAEVLNGRFHDLLLGHNFAQQQLGYIHSLDFDYGEKYHLVLCYK